MDARHLARLLAEVIERDGLRAGARLPSQAALMKEYGVSRHVVRKSLEILEERKFITCWQGSGAFVRGREWPYAITNRTRIHKSLQESGADMKISVLKTLAKRQPPVDVANLLGVSFREKVHFIEFLLTADGEPIALGHHFIHPTVTVDILQRVQETGEIADAYAAIGIDDYFRMKTMVRVRMPSERETDLLDIPRQQPLFVLLGLNVDVDQNPLEVTEAVVRGDRIRLDI
ncbi:GntR family transcriptional regulator [Roseibium limicola]|uniref:GntR family transcriptional regulator n=1 Tax=Roseibium limicola TaxID=2816037 RepID=UPI001E3DCA08|nr:GntR family transcriptional regulator [Roseibium limicola]